MKKMRNNTKHRIDGHKRHVSLSPARSEGAAGCKNTPRGRTATNKHAGKSPSAKQVSRSSRLAKHADGPCPLMHQCGGCEWLNLPYRKQLARKHAAMDELFADIIKPEPIIPHFFPHEAICPSVSHAENPGSKLPSPRAFRYKAATPFAPGPHGEVVNGFYARGTHDIIEVPACCVEAPGARDILNGVARIATKLGIPAYNEDTREGLLRYAVLRLGWKSNEGILTIVTVKRDFPQMEQFTQELARLDPRITTVAQNINPRTGNALLGGSTYKLFGTDRMTDELLSCEFEISPTAFYQTNPAQTEKLYQVAIDGMGLKEGDVLLDTYCGSGTIGLCAISQAQKRGIDASLIGVERNPAGIADARCNAELNNLQAASTFICEDATEYMRKAAENGLKIDVLSMDPPRAGSTPEFIQAAAALKPRTIIYISCNPITQARDLLHFQEQGYRVTKLTPVDMFPHTTHVETVAILTQAQ